MCYYAEVLLKNVKKLNVGSIYIIHFTEGYWYLDSTSLAIWYSLPPRLSFLFLKCNELGFGVEIKLGIGLDLVLGLFL